jgi:Transposase domain (DUF772)
VGDDDGSAKCGEASLLPPVDSAAAQPRIDAFVEGQCARFYAKTMGRPGLPPGIYFRLLLIGYFEGIDTARGIGWRAADSLVLRDFLGLNLPEARICTRPWRSAAFTYADTRTC